MTKNKARTMDKLSRSQRHWIAVAAGLRYAKILQTERDEHGYPDCLLEARDHSGFKFRGWWREGESAWDIDWLTEDVDGWPVEVCLTADRGRPDAGV